MITSNFRSNFAISVASEDSIELSAPKRFASSTLLGKVVNTVTSPPIAYAILMAKCPNLERGRIIDVLPLIKAKR